MVRGKFQCRGVLLIWIIEGSRPIALVVRAVRDCLDIFSLVYYFSLLTPVLWETVRYRLKYCHKGPVNLNQPTNKLLLQWFETFGPHEGSTGNKKSWIRPMVIQI